MTIFTLGTRGSLLAVTQSTLIKNQLEELYPQHQFNLKTIKTQGDIITDKPLWQLEGKDFFTKELDDALQAKTVDLVVHSCKDLSSTRPNFIKLAAITKRSFPNDLLLIHQDTLKKIQNKSLRKITVGTSSPRRQYLLHKELKNFLPFGNELEINYVNLRGNVNTRIEKLKSNEYDLICLAAAGLERLAMGQDSSKQLTSLLDNLLLKFLPLSVFPSAPSQGALAIECSKDNQELILILSKLNCQKTLKEVQIEKKLFQQYGGGCHLALGVYSYQNHANFQIVIASGKVDNLIISEQYIDQYPLENLKQKVKSSKYIFSGLTSQRIQELRLPATYLSDETKTIREINNKPDHTLIESAFYLTSEHTLKTFTDYQSYLDQPIIWTSGATLHHKLSQLGYWVCGDNDSFGNSLLNEIQKSVIEKYILKNKKIAQLSYQGQNVQDYLHWDCYSSTYQLATTSSEFKDKINSCLVFLWTSSKQYEFYKENFPQITQKETLHFCGIGKTFDKIQKQSPLKINPIINMKHFINFINSCR